MAVTSTIPDVGATLVIRGGNYIYALDQGRSRGTVFLSTSGVLSLLGTFAIRNAHVISDAIVDGASLVITTDHRMLVYSLADPEVPVLSSTTVFSQRIRGVTAITTGEYWLATDEGIAAQSQEFPLPTTQSVLVGGTLVMLSAASGTAENTDTPFDSGGGEVPINTVATPVILPDSGEVLPGASVTITTTTPSATIYYTTDGSTPTIASTLYSGAFTVTGPGTTTVKAFAIRTGWNDSAVATEAYTFAATATPAISPASGEVATGASITITCATGGASIYYTVDGSTPTPASTLYTGAFTITGPTGVSVKAMATSAGRPNSGVATNAYTFTATATPVISPASGAQSGVITVTITCATGGASIYYTVDGSTPTPASTLYTGGFPASANVTVKAMATSAGRPNSGVDTAVYTFAADGLRLFTTAPTTINPFTADGSVWSNQTIASMTGPRQAEVGRNDATGTVIIGGGNGDLGRTTNGLTWTRLTPAGMGGLTGVRYGNGVWVALSNTSTPFTSTDDGATWVAGSVLSGPGAFGSLSFANGLFFACFGSSIYSSADGLAWSAVTTPDPSGNVGVVMHDGTQYFMGSRVSSTQGNLYSSVSLAGPWTTVSLPTIGTDRIFIVACRKLNGVILVSGMLSGAARRVYRSTDGVTFSAVTLPGAFATTDDLYGFEYFAGKWWMAGYHGDVGSSTDSITWADEPATGAGSNHVTIVFYRQ
jgi:uncharacterized Fe-S cluster protein YjdI